MAIHDVCIGGSSGRDSSRPGKFVRGEIVWGEICGFGSDVSIAHRSYPETAGRSSEKLRLLLGLEVVSILVAIFL